MKTGWKNKKCDFASFSKFWLGDDFFSFFRQIATEHLCQQKPVDIVDIASNKHFVEHFGHFSKLYVNAFWPLWNYQSFRSFLRLCTKSRLDRCTWSSSARSINWFSFPSRSIIFWKSVTCWFIRELCVECGHRGYFDSYNLDLSTHSHLAYFLVCSLKSIDSKKIMTLFYC